MTGVFTQMNWISDLHSFVNCDYAEGYDMSI